MTQADEKWELPEGVRFKPETAAAHEKAQAEWAARAASPFASLTPQEQERERAARLIEEHKATLAALDSAIARAFTRASLTEEQRREYEGAAAARPHVAAQLAEAYASAGRFDLAAKYEPGRKQKADYLRIWRAVWRDDSHSCACEPHRGSGQHARIEVPTQYVRKDIYSVRHDAVLPLVACSKCRCLNVQPLPRALAEQRAHRARALSIAEGLKPAEAAERLRELNHTTEALLK